MTSLFPFFPFSWNQITLCRGRNQRYVQNRQIQPCHFDKYCSLTLRNNSVVLQPSTRQHIHPISADTLGEDDFQDEHLQQEPRQGGALWEEDRGGEVEGADHPWEEKAGHLEVRFCKQFISHDWLLLHHHQHIGGCHNGHLGAGRRLRLVQRPQQVHRRVCWGELVC